MTASATFIVQFVEETALPGGLEAEWLAALPAPRRAQLAGRAATPERQRSLIGSRLLRHGLRQLGFAADVLTRLNYSSNGKPSLELPVEVSLSHCPGRILCALSTDGPVGVDVEPVGYLTAAEFPNFLSADERAWAGDDPRRFCSLWTRKEAVVKAAGSSGLAQLRHVRLCRHGAALAGARWYTAPVDAERGFIAHVAQARAFRSVPDCRRVAFEALG